MCVNVLYEKLNKKKTYIIYKEREVFKCSKLAPCGPALGKKKKKKKKNYPQKP